MFLLLWLPCLSMRRLRRVEILPLEVDVRVKVRAGEKGGEKKTCFFLFSLPVPLPHPLWWTFEDLKKMHVMQALSIITQ